MADKAIHHFNYLMFGVAKTFNKCEVEKKVQFYLLCSFLCIPSLTSNLFTGIQQIQITQANRDRQRENIKNRDK